MALLIQRGLSGEDQPNAAFAVQQIFHHEKTIWPARDTMAFMA